MYIDTHCHLDYDSYDDNRDAMIQRSIKAKIVAMITIGTNIKSSEMSIKLAERFATVYAAVGIHPNDCMEASEVSVKKIGELCAHQKVKAIGEIGLDYYRDYTPKERQIQFFRNQLKIAREVQLPVIIHNRQAHTDVYNTLVEEKSKDLKGVFHSFDGDVNFLDSILAYNFHVSLTGVVTFKNANYDELIKRIPLENLLLETDSPFLAPEPFRGKRNEPSYIKYTAEKIAKVKEVSVKELAEITTANARELFDIKD